MRSGQRRRDSFEGRVVGGAVCGEYEAEGARWISLLYLLARGDLQFLHTCVLGKDSSKQSYF